MMCRDVMSWCGGCSCVTVAFADEQLGLQVPRHVLLHRCATLETALNSGHLMVVRFETSMLMRRPFYPFMSPRYSQPVCMIVLPASLS